MSTGARKIDENIRVLNRKQIYEEFPVNTLWLYNEKREKDSHVDLCIREILPELKNKNGKYHAVEGKVQPEARDYHYPEQIPMIMLFDTDHVNSWISKSEKKIDESEVRNAVMHFVEVHIHNDDISKSEWKNLFPGRMFTFCPSEQCNNYVDGKFVRESFDHSMVSLHQETGWYYSCKRCGNHLSEYNYKPMIEWGV
ncbi:MAG: hypothetical protein PHU12_02885 [Candidatus Aenigmarchaeota archaeon]|nr:hypothetical protein [Candidatus Aenigmarchaeota archaeon]